MHVSDDNLNKYNKIRPTDRFISADCPQLVKEHYSSEDSKDDSFKHE